MLKGDRFGRLTFVSDAGKVKTSKLGVFTCDCGTHITTYIANVKRGKKSSCGCLRLEYLKNPSQKKHGLSQTPTYSSWMNMMYRCNNDNATGYENYGGRGISVCDRWHDFRNFLKDMGERPKGMSIDRLDTNGNYELSNCKWSTRSEQSKNCRKDKVSSSIYKGVSFHKNTGLWEAYIKLNEGRFRIGYYNSEIEAFNAYKIEHEKRSIELPMYVSR